jgi:hypothetical protein
MNTTANPERRFLQNWPHISVIVRPGPFLYCKRLGPVASPPHYRRAAVKAYASTPRARRRPHLRLHPVPTATAPLHHVPPASAGRLPRVRVCCNRSSCCTSDPLPLPQDTNDTRPSPVPARASLLSSSTISLSSALPVLLLKCATVPASPMPRGSARAAAHSRTRTTSSYAAPPAPDPPISREIWCSSVASPSRARPGRFSFVPITAMFRSGRRRRCLRALLRAVVAAAVAHCSPHCTAVNCSPSLAAVRVPVVPLSFPVSSYSLGPPIDPSPLPASSPRRLQGPCRSLPHVVSSVPPRCAPRAPPIQVNDLFRSKIRFVCLP